MTGFFDAEARDGIPVADLTAEMDLELGRVKEVERPYAASTGAKTRPERLETVTKRRDHSHAGDHDAARMCHDVAIC
jgi:hypothetical protein